MKYGERNSRKRRLREKGALIIRGEAGERKRAIPGEAKQYIIGAKIWCCGESQAQQPVRTSYVCLLEIQDDTNI
jgi:hypothetical protein